jgi:hypothetical protein
MMPIDPTIALQVRPVEIPDQVNQLARLTQVQNLMQDQELGRMKMDAYSRDQTRKNALQALAGGWTAETSDDQRLSALKNAGFFDEASKLEDGLVKRREVDAKAQGEKANAIAKYADATKQYATRVMADPRPETAALALDSMLWVGKALGFDNTQQIAAERQALASMTPDQIRQWAAGHALSAEKLLPQVSTHNAGGFTFTQAVDPITGKPAVTGKVQNTQSPDNAATTSLGYAKLNEDKRHHGVTEKQQAEQVTQGGVEFKQDANGQWIALPKKVGPGPIQARPVEGVPGKKEAAAKNILAIVDEAEKLIGDSTGSYLGAAYDLGAQAVGKSTAGAQATAQLKVLEGQLMMAQPRMEGPQSDKDVALYRQMAGQIGDPTVPRETKKAALSKIKSLQQKYAGTGGASGGWDGGQGKVVDFGSLK